ncbi:hypothetical protein [Fortiea sp. LEGE XX443]|nr:hypothetical protein [Fortiea sp. LEGE XX443]
MRSAKSQVSQNLQMGLLTNIGIMAIAALIALSQVGTMLIVLHLL